MDKASIIIRCYNEEAHIGRLLTGIMQQTLKDREVIVVDSGSTDRTLDIASKYPLRILSISPENFSFGRSLNMGCDSARGAYIVFASAHVYPLYQDWLERLISPLRDPEVAMVYGKQRGAETTAFSEHQVFAKWFSDESNENQRSPFCNNANAAIRKDLWRREPYDETLTGLEDLEWAKRILSLGFKLVYEAGAEVVHIHNENLIQIYNRYRREAIALKHIFNNETFRFQNFARLFATNVFHDCRRALGEGVFTDHWAEILCFRFMQFWGTYKGFSQKGPITSSLQQTFYYPYKKRVGEKSVLEENRGRRLVKYDET